MPDAGDEAIRDLVRGREAARVDQLKARQRLKGFLLRHGFRYSGKSSWTEKHRRYLASLVMPFPAQQIVVRENIEAITTAGERLERLTKAMEDALASWRMEPVVRALMCLRGVNVLRAMILIAEAGDLTRFDSPVPLMSYFGLTSCESSTGDKRVQGGLTKCGNGAGAGGGGATLPFESARRPWLQKRQEGQSREVRAIAYKAQQRLHARHKALAAHRKKGCVIVAALARELCGFVWAIACQVSAPEKVKMRAEKSAPGQKMTREYELSAEKKFTPRSEAQMESGTKTAGKLKEKAG